MAAVYPGAVKAFGSDVVDSVDIVYAAHINDLRAEVVAVETELGTGLKASTWTGSWTNATPTWGSLSLRLINIERGIVTTSDVHPQYLKKAGDAMTGALDMGSQKITTLGAGTAATDAVNYGQVILRSGANAMSADLSMGTTYKITNLANGTNAADAVNKGQLDTKLNTSGGTVTGTLTMSGATIAMGSQKITGLANGTTSTDAVNKGQLDAVSTVANAALPKAGGTMTGAIAMGNNKVTGLDAASANGDAVRYEQVVPVSCSGRRATPQTAGESRTGVTYETEEDPHGMLNISTGVATLPSAGTWFVTGYVLLNAVPASSDYYISILVNDSGYASFYDSHDGGVAARNKGATVSALIVNATPGTTVKLQAGQILSPTASQPLEARFAVAKVGL